jgi:predicted esterase
MNIQWVKCFLNISFFLIAGVSGQYDSFETHVFIGESGDTLPYRLLKPLHEDNAKSYPLVLFLHGAGDVGNDNISQLNNFPQYFLDSSNRESFPCYIVAPQCPEDGSWDSFPYFPDGIETSVDPTPAMALVISLIDSLRNSNTINIDKNRVYVIGFSLGGEGTYDILTREPDWFAAAVPICGIADTGKAQLIKDIPLWIFHGSLDEINDVKYDRMEVKVLQALGSKLKYTEYENLDHNCWETAYSEPDLIPWMFAQNKTDNSPIIRNRKLLARNSDNFMIKNHSLITTWNFSINPEMVELYSLNGKCVFKHSIIKSTSSSISLLLPHYAPGKYLLRLVIKNMPIYIQTITLP